MSILSLFLLVLAAVLFLLAGILLWPSSQPKPVQYGWSFQAFGLLCLTVALALAAGVPGGR